MTQDEIDAEKAKLNTLLQAREHRDGYKANCKAIRARLDDLETLKPE